MEDRNARNILSTMCIQVLTQMFDECKNFQRIYFKISWKTHIKEKLPDSVPDRAVQFFLIPDRAV